MKEVKLKREKRGAPGKEWGKKRESRRTGGRDAGPGGRDGGLGDRDGGSRVGKGVEGGRNGGIQGRDGG